MNRSDAQLRALAKGLREHGATSLYLFGSTSRNEARSGSDLDLFIDYDPRGSFNALAWSSPSGFWRKASAWKSTSPRATVCIL
jgi:predicted nucleotidyltransferase